ncbi:cystathionine beta-lyase PatB [Gracilibacillus halophilus YIM-C55.5]|uniref:cysteine-S-conjugate beta-lyase n=1 Tax=Gracilibacillus halophilus YIM-C55.5 TaxID=1308866 RepID=N4WA02_9BACI|nr:MalY/PatB family protein [Gracilibacillus halophilus]ENH97108.1 cystathionine beta-lyase PatB [Gracilibacillus halophilus YIM-C55.5]
MKQEFQKVIDRKNTRAVKWDLVQSLYGSDDVLPMWVADMDFQVPSAVREKLTEKAQHGIFGYTFTDTPLNKNIRHWIKNEHDWDISESWIIYSPGVVSTLYMAVQALTEKNDQILIQTPVYPPFYKVIKDHDRQIVENPLTLKDNEYKIDFDDFEQKLKNGVKAFILCNPHNPIGRVWTKDELQQMIDLCKKYNVFIFSDEIHADLVFEPHRHIPIASLDEEINDQTITLMSPTKTFNLAGLQVSYAVISNKELRDAVQGMLHKQGLNMINTMGVAAIDAAYSGGKEWLTHLKEHLEENIDYVEEQFKDRADVTFIRPEGTYLLWLDFRSLGLNHDNLKKFIQEKAKVGLNDGMSFGEAGSGFLRMNVACPLETVKEGVQRIIHALDNEDITAYQK